MGSTVRLDDADYLKGLLSSMGVTEFEDAVIEALQKVIAVEYEAVMYTASRACKYAEKEVIDHSIAKFACQTHEIMNPPDAQQLVHAARIHNARMVGWPLGSDVRVPLHQIAQLHEIRKRDISTFPADSEVTIIDGDIDMNASGKPTTATVDRSNTDATASNTPATSSTTASQINSQAATGASNSIHEHATVTGPVTIPLSRGVQSGGGKTTSLAPSAPFFSQ